MDTLREALLEHVERAKDRIEHLGKQITLAEQQIDTLPERVLNAPMEKIQILTPKVIKLTTRDPRGLPSALLRQQMHRQGHVAWEDRGRTREMRFVLGENGDYSSHIDLIWLTGTHIVAQVRCPVGVQFPDDYEVLEIIEE